MVALLLVALWTITGTVITSMAFTDVQDIYGFNDKPFFHNMDTIEGFNLMQLSELAKARQCLNALAQLPLEEARNATITLGLYDCAQRHVHNVQAESGLMIQVHPLPAYRAAAEAMQAQATNVLWGMPNSTMLERLQAMDATKEDPTTQVYAEEVTRSRKAVDKETTEKIATVWREISQLSEVCLFLL